MIEKKKKKFDLLNKKKINFFLLASRLLLRGYPTPAAAAKQQLQGQ
jgi:hypothetical protein